MWVTLHLHYCHATQTGNSDAIHRRVDSVVEIASMVMIVNLYHAISAIVSRKQVEQKILVFVYGGFLHYPDDFALRCDLREKIAVAVGFQAVSRHKKRSVIAHHEPWEIHLRVCCHINIVVT